MMFRDRHEAGERLGERLRERGLGGAAVLGIPRGGVVVADAVARAIGGELGVVVARKMRAPEQPELAIGAVASDGSCFIEPRAMRVLGVDHEYLEAERRFQSEEARRRELLFGGVRRPDLSGRVVIVVDDGVATGATAMAALKAVRAAGASRVVFGTPVGSSEAVHRLESEADRVECLVVDPELFAVGEYYQDFAAVEDVEVVELLDAAWTPREQRRRAG
jgi:putative phosphoribosyl transferase